jgi:ABC-type bacteriocin/lantibiotic exporter with double-glycine peptidase domain
MERASKGLEERFFSTLTFIYFLISRSVVIVSLSFYLFHLNVWLLILLVIGSVIFTLIKTKLFKEVYILERKQTKSHRKLNDLDEVITGKESAAEVRLYRLQDYFLNKWGSLYEKMKQERIGLATREFKMDFIGSGGLVLTLSGAFNFGVFLVSRAALTLGQYAGFITSVKYYQQELEGLFTDLVLVVNDLQYIKDFFSYMELEEEKDNTIKPTKISEFEQIIFHNVSFRYPGSNVNALKNVNLTIAIGERIALLGLNGSGKTTLIKLILGLYEPTEGKITVDDINLKSINQKDWFEKMGIVLQDFCQ